MTVTPAPPYRVTFHILTPPEGLIAGDTIIAVDSIFNHDGLVPGPYCYPNAVYQDSVGKGPVNKDPVVIADTSGLVNQIPDVGNMVKQCFNNGVDTVKFVLYYAPYHDPYDPTKKDIMHTLFVVLDTMHANTGPFRLLPGPLNAIRLEDANGAHLTDTIKLAYPSGQKEIYAMGYDRFGNKRGLQLSNWIATPTLHAPAQGMNVAQIDYEASTVTGDESGLIIATALRGILTPTDSVSDSVAVTIKGPPSAIDSAVTKDDNGDGLLDRIVIYLHYPDTIPAGFSLAGFSISYRGASWTIDSIGGLLPNGKVGTVFDLYLHQDSTLLNGAGQTGWTPTLTATTLPKIGPTSVACKDGAGPVIWRVTKTIVNLNDRTQDKVTVVFSEPIYGSDGGKFKVNTSPDSIFAVWTKEGGVYLPVDSLFSGLTTFSGVIGDTAVEFYMSNAKDLRSIDYLSIKNNNSVMDMTQEKNYPNPNNRKVRVNVVSAYPNVVIPVPNPSTTTFKEQPAGFLEFANQPQARKWVYYDKAGVVLTFKVPQPRPDGKGGHLKVPGHMRIYDVVGNLVQRQETGDIYSSSTNYSFSGQFDLTNTSSSLDYDLYWNGSNAHGMPVAAGAYQVQIVLDFPPPQQKVVLKPVIVGIAK